MPADAALVAHALELFAPAGVASARRMFGGHGLYVDGLMVAVVFDDRLYLKADAVTRPAFVAAGCVPFVYTGQKAPIEISYWSLPEAALDSAEDMAPWLRRALEAAGRKALAAQKPKPKANAKPKRKP